MIYSECQLGLLARAENEMNRVFIRFVGLPLISFARASTNRVLFTLPPNKNGTVHCEQCPARATTRKTQQWESVADRAPIMPQATSRLRVMRGGRKAKRLAPEEQMTVPLCTSRCRESSRFHQRNKLKKSYYEQLKDPRWQKRRLEILAIDNFICGICSDGESELHVHHRHYRKSTAPWDYADEELITLCKQCHEDVEQLGNRLRYAASYRIQFEIFSLIVPDIESRPEIFLKLANFISKSPEKLNAIVNLLEEASND